MMEVLILSDGLIRGTFSLPIWSVVNFRRTKPEKSAHLAINKLDQNSKCLIISNCLFRKKVEMKAKRAYVKVYCAVFVNIHRENFIQKDTYKLSFKIG